MSFEDELSDHSSRDESPEIDRAAILTPAITSVITALGGQQNGIYELGDEAYGCLKDLKKFWRKDDTDDERTVARIFWKARLLQNDLVPILLQTAGKGKVEDRCAIICAELITSMTWPLDMASELMELDEELDAGTDYTALLQSHLSYKAALLQQDVLQAFFGIMLPCLAKTKKERTQRDGQIISIILHLFRNLAFIKDPPPKSHLSTDQAEYSCLQSKLISTLFKTHILDALVTLAVNAENDPLFNSYNTILLETFYLLFRGVKPSLMTENQTQVPKDELGSLLALEDKRKRNVQRNAASRHSRFGTTITVKAGDTSLVLHSQEAIKKEARDIIDGNKKMKHQKVKTLDELASQENLTPEALTILESVAQEFVRFCFNPFLGGLLKDIKSERPKITEKDNLRLLFVTKWFLEFFLCAKNNISREGGNWSPDFPMVSEVIDRSWIVWILRRMRGALDEKPKQWVELQAGIECLTQFLLLIDGMSSASDSELVGAAEVLQHQLYYNGEILDLAIDSIQGYKEQSVAYLDSSICLSYVLLRMLERWGKRKGDVYVRRRKSRAKNRRKGVPEEEGVVDVADVEDEIDEPESAMIEEQMFTFDKFEAKFANEDIAHTLLVYLSRFRELSAEHVKRVVGLIHRQAVKAKAEGLFFKVSTLDLFKSILAEQKSLPNAQPYKDMIQLINYILRQFFKAAEKDPFLVVEAFFPKNRGMWKPFSSWQPETRDKGSSKTSEELWKHPPDVKVKKGYSWSEQLAIAIACLLENDQQSLINWMKEILSTVIRMRQQIVDETDSKDSDKEDEILSEDEDEDKKIRREAGKLKGPSAEAIAKFEDYLIPYVTDEQADAATKNPHFKLVCRLVRFALLDDNARELEWYVPAAILPVDLQGSLNIINQYLETPLDLDGKRASQLLSKQRRRRAKRRRAPIGTSESNAEEDEELPKRKERKKKEQVKYKSAQFIEDSDAELGDDEEFFRKEAAVRERTALAAAQGNLGGNMKPTGTKRRKKHKGENSNKKKWRTTATTASATSGVPMSDDNSSDSEEQVEDHNHSPFHRTSENDTPATTPDETSSRPRRPKPRPKFNSKFSPDPQLSNSRGIEDNLLTDSDQEHGRMPARPRPKPKFKPSMISDSEEEPGTVVDRTTKRKSLKAVLESDDEL